MAVDFLGCQCTQPSIPLHSIQVEYPFQRNGLHWQPRKCSGKCIIFEVRLLLELNQNFKDYALTAQFLALRSPHDIRHLRSSFGSLCSLSAVTMPRIGQPSHHYLLPHSLSLMALTSWGRNPCVNRGVVVGRLSCHQRWQPFS